MITYEALVRYAKTLKGEVLETSARHKKFTVEVIDNGLAYTIENGNEYKNNKPTIDKVLARFNETKSYRPVDYQELTFLASYLMRILEMMVSEGTRRNE